jgi:hypothetical protein
MVGHRIERVPEYLQKPSIVGPGKSAMRVENREHTMARGARA